MISSKLYKEHNVIPVGERKKKQTNNLPIYSVALHFHLAAILNIISWAPFC